MDFFPENYDVTVSVSLEEPTGADIDPTAVTAVLLDQDGEQIQDLGSQSFTASADTVAITVPKEHLDIPASEVRRAFVVSATLTFPAGSVVRNTTIGIEKSITLVAMKNSFASFASFEILSMNYFGLDGWTVADDNQRKSALIEAYKKITRIPMRFTPRDADGKFIYDQEKIIPVDLWREETKADFDAYPEDFRDALRRAQFLEAENLLKGDVIAQMRKAGIKSETIGESQITLSENVADLGICNDTLSALSGYIDRSISIGRA